MAKHKYWCFGTVQRIIYRLTGVSTSPLSGQEECAKIAIAEALEEILMLPDGEYRVKLLRMIYEERKYTLAGAARKVYVSERTATTWNSDFVYRVARKMGFLPQTLPKKEQKPNYNQGKRGAKNGN